jgi:hypothetical protein
MPILSLSLCLAVTMRAGKESTCCRSASSVRSAAIAYMAYYNDIITGIPPPVRSASLSTAPVPLCQHSHLPSYRPCDHLLQLTELCAGVHELRLMDRHRPLSAEPRNLHPCRALSAPNHHPVPHATASRIRWHWPFVLRYRSVEVSIAPVLPHLTGSIYIRGSRI